jgi:hypothetical protein
MVKLNQIVAVVNGKKTEALAALTAVHRKCAKLESFSGLHRTYRPLSEDGETFPDESKAVQYTAREALDEAKEIMSKFFDVVATQEYANCEAKADVVVGGQTVLEQVPVSYLLFLEKQVTDFKTFVSNLPTLEVGEQWSKDVNGVLYVGQSFETNKNKKVLQHKVLYEATKEHPAQVEKWSEDVTVGKWLSTKYSGAIPVTERSALVNRAKDLLDAIKFARESANNLEVNQVNVGDKLFAYLYK